MKPASVAEEPRKGLECEMIEVRYSRLKICHFCTLTKLVPEEDNICKDCWALRMVDRALVACPFFQYEQGSLFFPDGRIPIEFCYDCAFRRGWTLKLGPVCSHPVAVDIFERWGIEIVKCPDDNYKSKNGAFVPVFTCRTCSWYKGELTTEDGCFTYCGLPCARQVCSEEQDLGKELTPRGWQEKKSYHGEDGSKHLG